MRFSGPALGLMLSLLVGCAMPQTASLVASPGDLPARAEVASVPFFPQERYYCGPAALAMALAWSGLTVTQDDLVSQVYTPGKEGSLQADILAAARRNGRLAIQVGDLSDVLAEIAAGHPVLVFQNLALEWYPQWHFAVAIGYDLDTREIVLHSGRDARRRTSLSTFEATWERGGFWAVVVLPPERLPARGTERAVVRAAAGLERAARYKEAAVAYETILQRWPDSYVALMGLGNAHYATGNYREAEAAFRGAIARHPERPDPWNNLAHALVIQGLRAKAETAAHNAVRLAKRDPGPYIATLREISSKEGRASAQYSLGFLYDYGEGVQQDYGEAAKWYRKAAEQGLPEAQIALGILSESGTGVSRDLNEFHRQYSLAVENLAPSKTSDTAIEQRDRVAKLLSQEQLLTAERNALLTGVMHSNNRVMETDILGQIGYLADDISPSGETSRRPQ